MGISSQVEISQIFTGEDEPSTGVPVEILVDITLNAGIGIDGILLVDAPLFERIVMVQPGAVNVSNAHV